MRNYTEDGHAAQYTNRGELLNIILLLFSEITNVYICTDRRNCNTIRNKLVLTLLWL